MKFKAISLIFILLTSCKGSGGKMDESALNSEILKKLTQLGFTQISCEDSGSPPLKGSKGLFCFVSKFTREEAVSKIDEMAKDYAKPSLWAQDYGQYHVDYTLNQNPKFSFGFAVTRVKFRSGEYKDKSIEKDFESDIIFTPIAEY